MDTAQRRPPDRGRAERSRALWTPARLLVLVLVVLGFGLMASRPALPPQQHSRTADVAAARTAIDALLTPGENATALAALPADFTASTGVETALRRAPDGTRRAVHLGGGCSTPWGDHPTRWNFGVACKAHDLGYDLLRYAAVRGQPLDPGLREALDKRLVADMHARCAASPEAQQQGCSMVAWLYRTGLVLNSWHERWGPPMGQRMAPILAGVAAIGLLLMFRLRGWPRARRIRRPTEHVTNTVDTRRRGKPGNARAPITGPAVVGVASIVCIVLGESGIALARWAGTDPGWLWPATWLAQLAGVFFFAAGRANATRWREVTASGGRYRHYLACRAGTLLRPASVFAVVAFAMPAALELFGIGPQTTSTVVRIALHPLWLLGVYLLVAAAAPVMFALRARASALTLGTLAGAVLLAGVAAHRLDSQLPAYAGALALALLAQQVAFQSERTRLARPAALALACTAVTTLVLLAGFGAVPLSLLGSQDAAPVLSAPVIPVGLLAVAQLGIGSLVRGRLGSLTRHRLVARGADIALRAPMSLYLGFLTVMLLVVTLVATPSTVGNWLNWLSRPSSLLALCLPAVPAVVVFVWFERHLGPDSVSETYQPDGPGKLGRLLAHAATTLGVGYAVVGLFGLAIAGFGEVAGTPSMLGLSLEPIQSLVRMLLGMCMLHTVRTGASHTPSTWVLATTACVPPILAAATSPAPDTAALALQGLTAVFALAASVTTLCARIREPRAVHAAG